VGRYSSGLLELTSAVL